MSDSSLLAVTKLVPVRSSSGAFDITIGDLIAESSVITMIGWSGLVLIFGNVQSETEIEVHGSDQSGTGYAAIYKDPQTNTDPLRLKITTNARLSVPAHLIYGFDYIKLLRVNSGTTIEAKAAKKS